MTELPRINNNFSPSHHPPHQHLQPPTHFALAPLPSSPAELHILMLLAHQCMRPTGLACLSYSHTTQNPPLLLHTTNTLPPLPPTRHFPTTYLDSPTCRHRSSRRREDEAEERPFTIPPQRLSDRLGDVEEGYEVRVSERGYEGYEGYGGYAPRVFAPAVAEQPLKTWTLRPQVRDQQAFFGHFYPGALSVTVARVSIMSLSMRLKEMHQQIEELQEEEEDEILLEHMFAPSNHRHELSIWKNFGRNMRFGIFRDLSIYTLQRIYELLVTPFVSAKTLKSLVKSMPKSAVRKAERYPSTAVYVKKVAVSSFKSQIITWLAIFTFRASYDAYVTYYVSRPSYGAIEPRETFLKRLGLNALRCGLSCVLAGIGAAVGSCIRPGVGTIIGLYLTPQFAPLFI